MSMPLSNALQSQIITDAHFLHHPIVDSEFTRKLKICTHGFGKHLSSASYSWQ